MPRTKNDKITYETRTTDQNGEVSGSTKTTHMILSSEPNYIKLYINTLLTFKELPTTLNPLLLELLKRMSYADPEQQNGAQLIFTNGFIKRQIAEKLNIKVNTIEHALTRLCKSGILQRVGGAKSGAYQANPHLFGEEEWKDIKAIRATFDFNTGEVGTDFKSGESKTKEDTKNQAVKMRPIEELMEIAR